MSKSADAFRSIGEVSQLIGVAPHVLRYWETQFPLFSPVKRRDGRRYYRPDDVRLAAGLCEVLREDGMTIRGAKKQMAADRGAALRARGAARLGQAVETPAPVAAKPAKPRRPRKTADEPLPLFPELPFGDPMTAQDTAAAEVKDGAFIEIDSSIDARVTDTRDGDGPAPTAPQGASSDAEAGSMMESAALEISAEDAANKVILTAEGEDDAPEEGAVAKGLAKDDSSASIAKPLPAFETAADAGQTLTGDGDPPAHTSGGATIDDGLSGAARSAEPPTMDAALAEKAGALATSVNLSAQSATASPEWLDRLRALALAVQSRRPPLPPQAASLARELQRARAALV